MSKCPKHGTKVPDTQLELLSGDIQVLRDGELSQKASCLDDCRVWGSYDETSKQSHRAQKDGAEIA